eukprot:355915-Chlamydomonas_euryale.AAC.9
MALKQLFAVFTSGDALKLRYGAKQVLPSNNEDALKQPANVSNFRHSKAAQWASTLWWTLPSTATQAVCTLQQRAQHALTMPVVRYKQAKDDGTVAEPCRLADLLEPGLTPRLIHSLPYRTKRIGAKVFVPAASLDDSRTKWAREREEGGGRQECSLTTTHAVLIKQNHVDL